jgi:hypothetical protein
MQQHKHAYFCVEISKSLAQAIFFDNRFVVVIIVGHSQITIAVKERLRGTTLFFQIVLIHQCFRSRTL